MARPLVLEWSWATRGSSYCPVPEITGILPKVSWLFFKARAKRPYVSHTGRASNAEKQPTGPGPEGCDENGPAAAVLVGHVSIQICSLLAPCRRPILIATKYLVFWGQDTSAPVCEYLGEQLQSQHHLLRFRFLSPVRPAYFRSGLF